MALLSKYVLQQMKIVLDGAGITSFLYIAPQTNTVDPFVTLYPITVTTEYTFNELIEGVKIQFSIFSNNSNPEPIMDLASDIYNLISEYKSSDGTNNIICTHISQQQGPTYLQREEYWQMIIEADFTTQKNKGS